MATLGGTWDPFYIQDGDCRAFTRRIRGRYPNEIVMARGCVDHSLTAFVRLPKGSFVPLMTWDASRGAPSDWTENELDKSRRLALRSHEEALRANAAEVDQFNEDKDRRIANEVVEDTMADPASQEYVALSRRENQKRSSWAAPWKGRHTASEMKHNVFVKKFDRRTGRFDDGYRPAEAAKR